MGTAQEIDLLFLDLDQTISAATNPKEFSTERKKGTTVGKRVLKREQERVGPALLKLLQDHEAGKVGSFAAFKKKAMAIMKPAWKRVFEAGVRATGIKGEGIGSTGAGAPLVLLEPEDEKWLRSAMQHEMRFLNGMLRAVEDQTYKMPLPRRVQMYVRTMESFYDSARAIGLPATVLIHWKGKNDERTCVGCKYMFEHSPFTKKTLPTVPRSGMTPCLSNCRDRLLIRQNLLGGGDCSNEREPIHSRVAHQEPPQAQEQRTPVMPEVPKTPDQRVIDGGINAHANTRTVRQQAGAGPLSSRTRPLSAASTRRRGQPVVRPRTPSGGGGSMTEATDPQEND